MDDSSSLESKRKGELDAALNSTFEYKIKTMCLGKG